MLYNSKTENNHSSYSQQKSKMSCIVCSRADRYGYCRTCVNEKKKRLEEYKKRNVIKASINKISLPLSRKLSSSFDSQQSKEILLTPREKYTRGKDFGNVVSGHINKNRFQCFGDFIKRHGLLKPFLQRK